ncbi:HNH/endonuclease VII fold putative polymorphic toxin [Acinetobacter piscicola]|uniref:HNH/endonuclease VII fold putative polymorphic toxin n=1 Tax=Acinetobacter piscicola TaxID=2006115 RepID=UPI003556EEEB
MSNYVYTDNPSHWGNFYQFKNASGELRVIVEHTGDAKLHFHAGKAKGSDPRNYDFKNEKYQKIDFVDDLTKKADHHIYYGCSS